MIQISHLTKQYGEDLILKDVSLTIEDRDIYGIVGQSGVGKSTLLNCINRLEEFQSGTITVDGLHVETLGRRELRSFRKNMGMIFQNFSLIGRRNVYDNIAMPMDCWGYDRVAVKKRVEELAEMVGLTEKLKARPGELSGGQKQRVAIARALTLNPAYLLSDEATSALDPGTALSIVELLRDINCRYGITIVMVSHQLDLVESICNRVCILDQGQVAEEGPAEQLFCQPSEALLSLKGERKDV